MQDDTEFVPACFLPPTSARGSSAGAMWATPMAADYDRGPGAPATRQGSPNLTDMVLRCSSPGEPRLFLNPSFVESLMGFPQGWTELE